MTSISKAPPPYPKSHLLAASGIAALLSLALLVFPSREVEAKKTTLNLDLNNAEQFESSQSEPLQPRLPGESSASPFAQVDAQNPNTEQAEKPVEQPTEKVAEAPPADPYTKLITVANGDTLSTVFQKAGLTPTHLHEALNSSNDAKRFGQLKVGQVLEVKLTQDGGLQHLQSKLSDLETITLAKTDKGFDFKRDITQPTIRTAYAHGVIDSSLFLSAKRAGLSHNMTMDLANVFGYDIDFAQDIREGDEFEVIYEQKVVNGKPVGSGNILAARFVNRGKPFTAVRYTSKQGSTSYYTADGNSMRKAFIRTPVDFARISSRFSVGRFHPILNKIRAHKGVDYAAPRGTPIKAAGDGRVQLAGRRGGYGNTIIIQHNKTYTTLYGHMQGFAKGIKTGSMVKQGQVIGYIGTTGLSTGPHLHYEFQVNGVHVDPLSQKLAMADPISGPDKTRFMQMSKPLMAQMDQEKATMLALNKR